MQIFLKVINNIKQHYDVPSKMNKEIKKNDMDTYNMTKPRKM